ncbi:hypothetical protein [Variovorax paradoxus]|uniref:hypothetical protein n=1 Tax=Variovorax paradoxus TaxID=34073 RepID=UPI003D662663
MAFKKPTSHTAVPESPDRLFRDLPRRKHPSLFDHQGQVLRNYVTSALEASGNIVFVFEDHANAKGESSVIDATKARQAASHPDWMRDHVPGSAGASIQPVLVTPAKKAKEGALPHLGRVALWDLNDFRDWAEQALVTIRTPRRDFREPGDLAWRAQAAEALVEIRADAPGLRAW